MEKSEREKAEIPKQQVGNKLDTNNSVTTPNDREAQKLFDMAVDRLLDVNCWAKLCGPLSAEFKLTDSTGREIDTPAKPGDYFKIDIPGPGPPSGKGFDWVRIEALDDKRNPSAAEESVTIRVRPASSPISEQPDTAHFFKEEATSSFRIRRNGNIVTAEVHGRNEMPNTEAEKPADKIRNAAVGTGAIAAFSAPQWNSLVKGLLDTSIKVEVK